MDSHIPTASLDRHQRLLAGVDLREMARVLLLYAILVLHEFAQRYMLEHFFSKTMGYFQIGYDQSQPETYFWICVLTPLAILPAGTRLTTASQVIVPIFMAFVGLATPLYFVSFVSPGEFVEVYVCFFLCFLILALASRFQLRQSLPSFTEQNYKRLIAVTVLLIAAVFAFGMTQDFHLTDFSKIYANRYSEDANGAFVQRFVALYIFALGGLFLALSLMFRRRLYALLAMLTYVICYGLIFEKTAAVAPLWFAYMYFAAKYFSGNSTARFYLVLGAPFYVGTVWFALSPGTANGGGNLIQFAYLGLVLFRNYAIPANASGLYHLFFQTHPHTYWSHITGINFFVHYPYGNHTVAIEMERYYSFGNYNASFLASDAEEAYGYQALPFVGAIVGVVFVMLNTAARGLGAPVLIMLMIMPALSLTNIPFATSLLTSGLLFLMFYMASMPRSWLGRSQRI